MIIDYYNIGEMLYLVPITAVEGYTRPEKCVEDSRQILKTKTQSSEDVTSCVDPTPIN